MAGSEEPTRLEKCDGCRDWGCVWVPGELGAIPQEMALEDVQHHGFTPGHEQRGQQEGGTYLEDQEVQLPPPQSTVSP